MTMAASRLLKSAKDASWRWLKHTTSQRPPAGRPASTGPAAAGPPGRGSEVDQCPPVRERDGRLAHRQVFTGHKQSPPDAGSLSAVHASVLLWWKDPPGNGSAEPGPSQAMTLVSEREHVTSQRPVPGAPRKVTIYDVARAAGVGKQTVSNVLNGSGRVGAAARERVLEVVAELGYHPHQGARSLRSRRTLQLGHLMPAMHLE